MARVLTHEASDMSISLMRIDNVEKPIMYYFDSINLLFHFHNVEKSIMILIHLPDQD